jgi:hypothetical protein
MKIYSIEVKTDLGYRTIAFPPGAPFVVEPVGDMPSQFRSLTEILWGLVREIAAQKPSLTAPKAEA